MVEWGHRGCSHRGCLSKGSPEWSDWGSGRGAGSWVDSRSFSQGDYENMSPDALEDEGLHYSELVHFGDGVRSPKPEAVEYVTLKH